MGDTFGLPPSGTTGGTDVERFLSRSGPKTLAIETHAAKAHRRTPSAVSTKHDRSASVKSYKSHPEGGSQQQPQASRNVSIQSIPYRHRNTASVTTIITKCLDYETDPSSSFSGLASGCTSQKFDNKGIPINAWPLISSKAAMRTSMMPEFPLISSLRSSVKDSKLSNTFSSLFTKFKPSNRNAGEKSESLEQICFKLGIEGHAAPATESKLDKFRTESLKLGIKQLDGAAYDLILPPSVQIGMNTVDSGIGDVEEQGFGGTCDQFISMLPESCREISAKASPLGLVPKLLPSGIISSEARHVGSCFWIWLCIVDDLTENLTGSTWDETEADLFRAFSANSADDSYFRRDSEPVKVSLALRSVIDCTRISRAGGDGWRDAFRSAVCEVLTGFREERPLLGSAQIALSEWMRLRVVTISVRPFLILARADLGLSPTVSRFGDPLHAGYAHLVARANAARIDPLTKVECHLQLVMGLQNDILGWEKDSLAENPLNAIQILIQHGVAAPAAMADVTRMHNRLVESCIAHAEAAWAHPRSIPAPPDAGDPPAGYSRPSIFGVSYGATLAQRRGAERAENVRRYLELILGFANGMAMWMAVSKRYSA